MSIKKLFESTNKVDKFISDTNSKSLKIKSLLIKLVEKDGR